MPARTLGHHPGDAGSVRLTGGVFAFAAPRAKGSTATVPGHRSARSRWRRRGRALLRCLPSPTVDGVSRGLLGRPQHQRVDESAPDTAATNRRRRPHRHQFHDDGPGRGGNRPPCRWCRQPGERRSSWSHRPRRRSRSRHPMLVPVCRFVLVGHRERRRRVTEGTEADVAQNAPSLALMRLMVTSTPSVWRVTATRREPFAHRRAGPAISDRRRADGVCAPQRSQSP